MNFSTADNHTKDQILRLPKKVWKNKKNKKSYKKKQAEDLFYGELGEIETLPILNEWFGYKIKKLDRFNSFDFVSEDGKNWFEIKTRRNNKYKYPSTLVPTSKIIKAKKLLKRKNVENVYFVFNFEDVISLVKYSKDKTKFKYTIATGGRWDRNKDETKSYAYIFTSCLDDITEVEALFLSDSDDE
tara:strand:- start:732 stop:1289 length:558 start_codon:yes stop_codon:yes gene_type:complete